MAEDEAIGEEETKLQVTLKSRKMEIDVETEKVIDRVRSE